MLTTGVISFFLGVAAALPQASVFTEDGFTIYQNIPAKRQAAAPGAPGAPGAPVVIPVVVGGVQVTYMPNVVVAAPGNIVQFQFSAGNHTVTQSSEMQTCTPMQVAAGGAEPVNSGHLPFTPGSTTVSTFEMTINNTQPMFIYCATGPHCQLGQVMVINPVNSAQVVAYARRSASTPKSVDGTKVVGGTVGQIPLAQAAFDPPQPPPQQGAPGGAPGGAAAPAPAPSASAAPGPAPAMAPAGGMEKRRV